MCAALYMLKIQIKARPFLTSFFLSPLSGLINVQLEEDVKAMVDWPSRPTTLTTAAVQGPFRYQSHRVIQNALKVFAYQIA